MPTATEITDRLYEAWNDDGLGSLADRIDPAIELIPDPLRPVETALHGLEGWQQWVDRWERSYEAMQIKPDAIMPLDAEHVLALVSITATPRGGHEPLSWAAAHIWTVRDGRIAGWETHLDLSAARQTLDV
ncbi:MAG: nuclear transport factor 2 family protein [Solirubrobacteraceae bacterium]